MTIDGFRVAKSYRLPGPTPANPRYVRVDTARRVWYHAEPVRDGLCVYLGRLPVHVSIADRLAVLDCTERALGAWIEGADQAQAFIAPNREAAETATERGGNRHHVGAARGAERTRGRPRR